MDEKLREKLKEEFDSSREKPEQDKTFDDFLADSGCDKLNAASVPSDTINAVKKFNLVTAKRKGLDLVGLRENLRENFKVHKVPGAFNILKEAFKVEVKEGKKNDDIPDNFILPKPWPEPVNGQELLSEMSSLLQGFIILPDGLADRISLYIGSSYLLEAYDLFPYLHITSPSKGCGKSKLLEVVESLLPLGKIVVNPSTASLFRAVDKFQISVCFDEIDRVFKNNEEIMDFCVAAYRRKDAEGFMRSTESGDIVFFSAWGVKVMAGIGELQYDTLKDRTIRAQLQKKTSGEKIKRLRTKLLDKIALPIRRKLIRFAEDCLDEMTEIMDAGPKMPIEFEGFDRPAENWEPLVAFGDLCSESWGQRARNLAINSLEEKGDEESSAREELLRDMQTIFIDYPDGIHSKDLVPLLNAKDDRPWGGWSKGEGIKARDIAKQLKMFKIKSEPIRIEGQQLKGYKPEQFADVFARYVPSDAGGVTPVTPCYPMLPQDKKDKYQDTDSNIKEIGESVTANTQNPERPPKGEETERLYFEENEPPF